MGVTKEHMVLLEGQSVFLFTLLGLSGYSIYAEIAAPVLSN